MPDPRIQFANRHTDLLIDQSRWSQEVFGKDEDRGPAGALAHLALEAKEAEEAIGTPEFIMEMADCYLLLMDALRRSRHTTIDLLLAAEQKMKINKSRKWPKPETDKPVFHEKED